jgi:hypothetical protein
MTNGDGISTVDSRDGVIGQLNALREFLIQENRGLLVQNPELAGVINARIRGIMNALTAAERTRAAPADSGLSALIGLGAEGAKDIGDVRTPPALPGYEEQVAAERLLAIADLYYLYQHERLGVFRAVLKLQELFNAGQVRLSAGDGAIRLYQFDRQRVLRYTRKDRFQAYRRVFGYTNVEAPSGARPNTAFHGLFTNFNTYVNQFFRDRRIAELLQPSAGPSSRFGSIAAVRRAGLDLRNNLKSASYGHVNVLRVEVMQLLEQAFQILAADDVRRLFGADTGWDALEEVLRRYLSEAPVVSQRSRLAGAGRDILAWLAQPNILAEDRVNFEALLEAIGEACEEWLTSAESLGQLRSPTEAMPDNVVLMRQRMG